MTRDNETSGGRRRLATWCRLLAVVLGVLGAGSLVAWANRWYVTRQLARSLDGEDADFAVWVYERMALAHEALLTGVLLALAATTLAVLGRRTARRPTGPGAVGSAAP
jgi:hypothetical protein